MYEAFGPQSWANWAVVLAAIVAAYIATRTLNSIKRQADLMEDTAKRQLRAYLCISESLVKFTEDGCLEGQIHIKNGGQTPAYGVKCWSQSVIREHPLKQPLNPPPPDLLMSTGIIPSGDHHIMVARKLRAPEGSTQSIEAKHFAFYVHGEVMYEDIFKDIHKLRYRLLFGGPVGTRTHLDSNGVKCGLLSMDIDGNLECDV